MNFCRACRGWYEEPPKHNCGIGQPIKWDTGKWRNCFHQNPPVLPEVNTERKMCAQAKAERRYDVMWGVVNSGNAMCHSVHRTKREAEAERRARASAYVVIQVVVTPLYTSVEKVTV